MRDTKEHPGSRYYRYDRIVELEKTVAELTRILAELKEVVVHRPATVDA